MNLRKWFDLTFADRPNEIGLEWAGSEYTFGEIDARSNRMARALLARGLAKGDRVCVYLANSIEMIDLYLACVKLGVIFVPINILYRDREMSHILGDAEPKLLVTAAEVAELLSVHQNYVYELAGHGELVLRGLAVNKETAGGGKLVCRTRTVGTFAIFVPL